MSKKLKTIEKLYGILEILTNKKTSVKELMELMSMSKEGVYTYIRTIQKCDPRLRYENNKYYLQ